MKRLIGPPEDYENETKPYNEGVAAFNAGLGFSENPYPEDTAQHPNWYLGWYEQIAYDENNSKDDLEYYDSCPDYSDELVDADPFDFDPYDYDTRVKKYIDSL